MHRLTDYGPLPGWAATKPATAPLADAWSQMTRRSTNRRTTRTWDHPDLSDHSPSPELLATLEDPTTYRRPSPVLDALLDLVAAGDDTATLTVIYALIHTTCWSRTRWLGRVDQDLELLVEAATNTTYTAQPGTSMATLASRTRSRIRYAAISQQRHHARTCEPAWDHLADPCPDPADRVEHRLVLDELARTHPGLIQRRLGLCAATDSEARRDRRHLAALR